MKHRPTWLLVLLLSLTTLLAVGCGYGPDTSLPTDNVGPMLDNTTTPLTQWSPSAYRLILRYSETDNEFWILDVDEPTLYTWTPKNSSAGAIQDHSAAIYYQRESIKLDSNPNSTEAYIHGFVISDEGIMYRLPPTYLRGNDYARHAVGPWFSPDGKWRIHNDSGFELYSAVRGLNGDNEKQLTFDDSTFDDDGDFAWILAWNPDSTQFVMSAKSGKTYLHQVSGATTILPGEAGQMTFEMGQWLSDGRLALLKEEKLYTLDMSTNEFQQVAGLGRITTFTFSPDLHYLASFEKVDCEYRADNDSWFPGNEYCNEELFLYDQNLENRQRVTKFERQTNFYNPVWLPIEGTGPIWAVRSIGPN